VDAVDTTQGAAGAVGAGLGAMLTFSFPLRVLECLESAVSSSLWSHSGCRRLGTTSSAWLVLEHLTDDVRELAKIGK
jgi:hypothetical protein